MSAPDDPHAVNAEERWVEVLDHDPAWAAWFADEAGEIRRALDDDDVTIEHFGSTAVPGLAAKPIVDILIGASDAGLSDSLLTAIRSLGYEYLGEDERRPGRHFFRRRGIRSFNVSVVPAGGELWLQNVAIRDFLRGHPDWAARYAEVKHAAASASPESLLGYQDAKRAFVDELRSVAIEWSRAR